MTYSEYVLLMVILGFEIFLLAKKTNKTTLVGIDLRSAVCQAGVHPPLGLWLCLKQRVTHNFAVKDIVSEIKCIILLFFRIYL